MVVGDRAGYGIRLGRLDPQRRLRTLVIKLLSIKARSRREGAARRKYACDLRWRLPSRETVLSRAPSLLRTLR